MLRVLMFVLVIGALAYGGWVIVEGLTHGVHIDQRHAVTGGKYSDHPQPQAAPDDQSNAPDQSDNSSAPDDTPQEQPSDGAGYTG